MNSQIVPSRYNLPALFESFDFNGNKYPNLEALLQNVPASDPIEIPACLRDKGVPVCDEHDIFGYLEYGANLFILKYLKEKGVLQISFFDFLL
jgi:hypothetical protein